MHYVFLCDDMIHNQNIFSGFAQQFFNFIFTSFIRVFCMKSIVFLLAFVAMSTTLFAQHQVLGQSPRSAKIYTKQVSNHQVLGQSPRSAKIYNSTYVPTHIVLGQSPRSAIVYNSDGYELWKYRNGVFNVSLKSVK